MGRTGWCTATLFPERVKSVGFIANSGITPPTPSELDERRARGRPALLVSTREDYDRVIDFVFVERPFLPGPVRDYFADRAIANRDFNEKIRQDIEAKRFPLEPVLADIEAPMFVLWGDADRLVHISSIEVMKGLRPDATYVVMKKCGHLPMIERPEEAAGHYLAFLEGLGK